MVTKETLIEDIVSQHPESVRFLFEKGIKCIECGEPAWGTLEENARRKGLDEAAIERLVQELNQWLVEHP
jgi:hybrid cluster-associated redox disulfide protein